MRSLILLALASIALPVRSQVPTGPGDYLARMDSDHDGRVGIDEYLAWMTYAFDARDTDHNGVLEGAELPPGRGKPITRQALVEQLRERFARQDRDHDGFLDAKDLAAPPR